MGHLIAGLFLLFCAWVVSLFTPEKFYVAVVIGSIGVIALIGHVVYYVKTGKWLE